MSDLSDSKISLSVGELNEEQLAVVENGEGYCLVLAGAGTGKTRTLTHRVAYLLEKGIPGDQILLLTFTNKAANEMMVRVHDMNNVSPAINNFSPTTLPMSATHTSGVLPARCFSGRYPSSNVTGGTFHHFGNLVLRKHGHAIGLKPDFTILDDEDSRGFLKSCLKELKFWEKFPKPEVCHHLLSFAVNSDRDISEVVNQFYNTWDSEVERLTVLQQVYQRHKIQGGFADFDDLLVLWRRLLRENHEIRARLSSQYRYILVDEYQDTNKIQAEILRLMSSTHQNLLVVGDDAQSIYSFRAAEVSNILDFPKKYPGAKTFRLTYNYRSVWPILRLANKSIRKNYYQHEKELRCSPGASAEGARQPQVILLSGNTRQAEWVAGKVKSALKKNQSPEEIAVLFRANFQALELELELAKEGIIYIKRGGIRFFEQKHIKDVLAFLKIRQNQNDAISWHRVLELHEGVGEVTAGKIISAIKSQQTESLSLSTRVRRALTLIENLINKPQTDIQEMLKSILTEYLPYLRENFPDFKDREEDLNQLVIFSAQFTNLKQFLDEMALGERHQNEPQDPRGRIILSTIHQAKGLEWQTVFVVGLVQGQFPSYRSLENVSQMEEERRLFYVAVTRAKTELYLLVPAGFSAHSSEFLEELEQEECFEVIHD